MNEPTPWATLTPLRPDGTNLLPFPMNALPPILRGMVQAIATTTSTDPAMAGTAILSAVSYCFSGVYRMSAKRDHTVNLDTLCNTIDIGEYFREQAVYAYNLGDIDIGTVKAERVLNKIRSKGIHEIRQNDLYKLCHCTLFKNAQDFSETVDMLEEYKSGIMVFINPKI